MKLISPLQTFLIASIAIHGGLFVVSDSVKMALPGLTGSAMSVKLEERAQASIQPKTQPAQIKKITKPVQQASVSRYKQKISDKVLERKVTQPVATAIRTNSEAKAHVISIIYKELNNHFNYPKIAQRRNWQGQVLIAFRLNNDGTIEDIKIDHSSGYNILDQAAIVSLKKIGQLPQVSSWLVNGMEIQIPIIYQLTQG